jgi:hypothetical protein
MSLLGQQAPFAALGYPAAERHFRTWNRPLGFGGPQHAQNLGAYW